MKMVYLTVRQLLPPERNPDTPHIEGSVGHTAGLDVLEGKKNLSPLPEFFFVFSSTLYVIRTCFFVLIVLHLAFLSLLTTHNTHIHARGGI